MTDEDPQVVAAASLSPVSPRPLHNTYSLPQVLPDLQHQAENPDVVPLEPTTFRTAEAAMAPEPEATEPVQDAREDSSDSAISSIADDDSFVYEGDGDRDNGQAQETHEAPQEGDDYAMTFDSPMEKEQQDAAEEDQEQEQQQQQQQPQEAISAAPESITIPEQPVQPDPVDPQAPSLPEQGSLPTQVTTAPDTASSQSPENGTGASAAQEALPATIPATQALKADETAPEKSVDVQPKPEDVEMTSGDASDATSLDIQKLVDEITAKNEVTEQVNEQPANTAVTTQASASPADVDISSLPPKPALTQEQSKQTFSPATYHHASLPNAPNFPIGKPASLPSQPPQPAYANNGASAPSQTTAQSPSYKAPPAFPSFPNTYTPGKPTQQAPGFHTNGNGLQQTYDEFLDDERKAMAEAKWERFPDGSRIFIGNLSQERVSKRDVFELFHHHGRLAQISMKAAYGFVQYHTTAEAQSAMNALQGADVKGRKINLEISRTQKTKKDRDHSPERRNRGDRGDRGGRTGDRYDGGRRRDDFRGVRSPSPRRDESRRGRQEPYSRDRGQHDSYNRKRSRSPDAHRRHDSYRRRSPSPYGRGRQDSASDQLDIPRRYGNEVPDVQILMMQDVHKDFVDWVQRSFHEQGLRPNAMFLNPRFPREAVIQRQVLEGVHGVVELDMRAQNTAKISLQVFDRSAGNNVRFDQYQELDPLVAAQLVLRTKSSVAQQSVPAYPPQPAFAPQPGFAPHQPYGGPATYGSYAQPPVQQPTAAAPDINALVSQLSQMPNVDNATLQTIMASLQQNAPSHPPANYAAYQGPPQAGNNQVDLNALINNISAASANNGPPAMRGGIPGYGPPGYPQGSQSHPQPAAGSSDPARDVESILANFARYRQ